MSEPERYARTLVEAYLYVSLTASAAGIGEDAPRDVHAETTLTEGTDTWTLRHAGAGVEVLVRHATEAEARQDDLRFGPGVSTLIDAGQWLQIAAVYARRALREGLFFAQDPTGEERFLSIVDGWELARDATIEAAKFLPADGDEIPATAVWTQMGTSAREESPERFARERIRTDIAFCEQSLEDFRRLHSAP
ncbi:hypothetical protein [Actinomadura sp. DC4]|uniref:hypothetical protein n=1 Tax=Actinomadura sp. DC4 TaxID=3055069 RepID=UPI0025AFAD7A|nr:hypothetical protein [Actinomadura sp. DC4]MDN3351285.1 hypothetical protein [Actinomadura sp. DC4]